MNSSDVKAIGTQTELFFDLAAGLIEERDDYFVIRHPGNPNYWYGNGLFFASPPGPSDFERWMGLSRVEFGTGSEQHRCFRWDDASGDLGCSEPFFAEGFLKEYCDFLIAEKAAERLGLSANHSQRSEDWRTQPVTIRPLEGDDDWRAAFELGLTCDRLDSNRQGSEHERYLQGRYALWRELSQSSGQWWGLFFGKRLISDLGLYFMQLSPLSSSKRVGRFQSVKTHPSARRQGFCHQLVAQVTRLAFEQEPDRNLIISADVGSAAGRIYRSVGFEPREVLSCLIRPHADSK